MNKLSYIFLVVLLLLCTSCMAAAPFVGSNPTSGYDIVTTPYEFIKYGQDFVANFHLFNRSNGVPIGNFTGGLVRTCRLDLYNSSGQVVLETTLPYDSASNEWELLIKKGNFSLGSNAWIVYCNSSITGGFLSSTYMVTTDGFDDTPSTIPGISIILFMLFIIIGLLVLGWIGNFNKNEIVNLVIKRGCFVAAIMVAMYTTTLLLDLTNYAHLHILDKQMIFLMTWIGWAGYVATVFLVIMTIFDILNIRKQGRAKKDMEVSE